jgi:formate dehydrogenase assembly factor FdhD
MTVERDRGRPDAASAGVGRWHGAGWESFADELAVEEPLQLLLDGAPLSVLMRTPGHDLELAIGLLWAEGVLRNRAQLVEVRISAESGEREAGLPLGPDLLESNQVDLRLAAGSGSRPERSFRARRAASAGRPRWSRWRSTFRCCPGDRCWRPASCPA